MLVAGVHVKNLWLFDVPVTSSCLGMNLARVATFQLSESERRQLIREGVLSRYAVHLPFGLPVTFPEEFDRPRRGVPALDQVFKSTGGANMNHRAFIDLCREYEHDALATVRRRPGVLNRAYRQAWMVFFRPSGDFLYLPEGNRDRVSGLSRAYDLALGQGQEPKLTGPESAGIATVPTLLRQVAWVVVLAYLVVYIGLLPLLRRVRQREGRASPRLLLLSYAGLTLLYLSVVGNFLETGENNRFRFLLDPLVLALLVALVQEWRTARRAAPEPPERAAG
jgi:hypothetical protein